MVQMVAPPPPSGVPPPPVKKAPVLMDESEFDFTAEDVRQGAADLMRILPEPTGPIESSGPVLPFLVVGDRDCKSISAIAVGTSHCPPLPRPPGSKVVVIAWDTQSRSSFDNFLGKSGVTVSNGEHPHFIEMRKPLGRYRGLVDSENPANGAYMVHVFRELLKLLRQRQDIGGLLVDHYGIFLESRCTDYTLYMAGTRKFSDLQPSDWMPRKKLIEGTDELVRSVPIPGGWVGATGYRNRDDGDQITVIRPGGKREQAVVEAKWTRKVFANWPVVVQTYHTEAEDGKHNWHGTCSTGRVAGFQIGATRDLRNRHIGAFLLPE